MRMLHWPKIVDEEAREVRFAPVHLVATAAAAAFLTLALGAALAILG